MGVKVTYNCFPNAYGGFGFVHVQEKNGSSGSTAFQPVCNDRNVTQTVFVGGAFVKGDMAVQFSVCGFDCAFTTREIRAR